MTSQTGKQTITIHILPDILKNKGTQTMKFGQLIEYIYFSSIWDFFQEHSRFIGP